MSIQKIEICNFQSHKNTVLEFHKNTNVVIGSSDTGKTAILRALNWIVNNRPGGDNFRSSWGGDTTVDIKLEKEIISRKKGKENLYVISSNKGKQPLEFRAFGQDVPEPVKQLLNFSELNLQKQFDQPFLLSSSPGEVARYLNQIVNLDKIDIALANIGRTIRQETSNLRYNEGHLEELNEEIQEYNWLDEADGRLSVLENAEKEIISLARKENKLQEIIDFVIDCQEQLDEIEPLWEAKEEVERLLEIENEIT